MSAELAVVPTNDNAYSEWVDQIESNLLAVETVLNCTPFIVGDLINNGLKEFGETRVYQAFDPAKHPVKTLAHWAYISEKYPQDKRIEGLAYGVYQAFVGIKDSDERYALIQEALNEKWSVEECREHRKALKGESAPKDKLEMVAFGLDLLNDVSPALNRVYQDGIAKYKNKAIPKDLADVGRLVDELIKAGVSV